MSPLFLPFEHSSSQSLDASKEPAEMIWCKSLLTGSEMACKVKTTETNKPWTAQKVFAEMWKDSGQV